VIFEEENDSTRRFQGFPQIIDVSDLLRSLRRYEVESFLPPRRSHLRHSLRRPPEDFVQVGDVQTV